MTATPATSRRTGTVTPVGRIGVEIELLAPPGGSRRALADALAQATGGSTTVVFHHDTEPSLVAGRPVFHHLSHGYEVRDHSGAPVARLVDDVTIRRDLDPTAPTGDGYRIISDDARLLRVVGRHADPTAPVAEVLGPAAALFGTVVERRDGGRFRLDDPAGATVAMAVPQSIERERVCEIVTPVLIDDHRAALARLLEPARDAGFTVPHEAAVHIHLDADRFRDAAAFGRLVRRFADHRSELWQLVGTNTHCRRLGPLPETLVELVHEPGFDRLPWTQVEAALAEVPLTKYCDLNLVNLRDRTIGKDTVEIRILPGAIDEDRIVDHIEAIIDLVDDGDRC